MAEQFSADDKELLERAAAWNEFSELRDCSASAVIKVAQERGIEFATAVLYDRLLRHPEHGAFYRRCSSHSDTVTVPDIVGIIPGAFYREHRNTGANGARVVEILDGM